MASAAALAAAARSVEAVPADFSKLRGHFYLREGQMRLRGIVYEAANRYLDEEYLAEHNERFACEPAAAADFHQALPRGTGTILSTCMPRALPVGTSTI